MPIRESAAGVKLSETWYKTAKCGGKQAADCHSLASGAADLGFSELTIAALLGHAKASVTSRYTHHADATCVQAAFLFHGLETGNAGVRPVVMAHKIIADYLRGNIWLR
jgi:integrase